MNLYMISLGGKVKGCNLEIHDVQFVAANHIDETVELLKSNWYGMPEKLHMDSYKAIIGADGCSIRLSQEKTNNNKELFFVQLGGYKEISTQEQHEVGLMIGETEQEVEDRARKEIIAADIENHVDSIVRVETCLLSTDGNRYFIELSESAEVFDPAPDWFGYRRLDK